MHDFLDNLANWNYQKMHNDNKTDKKRKEELNLSLKERYKKIISELDDEDIK